MSGKFKSDVLCRTICENVNEESCSDANGFDMHPHFDMKDLYFRYSSQSPWILSGASLTVRLGERIGIMGKNGVGKSTIAKIILGLFRPNRGLVTLFGKSVCWQNHFPDLGYIGDPSYDDGAMALPNDLKVGQLLDTYAGLFQVSGRLLPYAKSLGIGLGLQEADIRNSKVGNLSKGQRQRVLVYLALAKGPSLLVADEATEGLDPKSRDLILNEIKRIAIELKMSLIWITHRYEEMISVTESFCEMHEGKLVQHKEELFHCKIKLNESIVLNETVPSSAIINQLGNLIALPSTLNVSISAVKEKGARFNER